MSSELVCLPELTSADLQGAIARVRNGEDNIEVTEGLVVSVEWQATVTELVEDPSHYVDGYVDFLEEH